MTKLDHNQSKKLKFSKKKVFKRFASKLVAGSNIWPPDLSEPYIFLLFEPFFLIKVIFNYPFFFLRSQYLKSNVMMH